jgi:outer membrane protein OmpA-like peptidoglycan-associated protein
MKFLTNIFASISKVAVKVTLAVVVMFAETFFIRAQESTERIYYRFDNAVTDASYMSNSQAFANIDSLLESGSSEGFEIVSYSSPEGDFNYNLNLSTRRAEALRKYLTGRYPQLAGKISINPNAESWNALRASVEADSRLSGTAKASMLQIIDSNESADVKEKKLAGLQSWRYLYANYFRSLRYAEIRFVGGVIEGKAAADTVSAAFSRNGLQSNAEEIVSAAATNASQAGAAAAQSVVSNNADNLIFALRSATIESEAHNNAAVLASIAGMISGRDIDEIASINIISTASPEGPEAINNRYSMQRGQALRDYIVSEYPALAGKITVHSAGEAWEDLRVAVDSDPALSDASRDKLLSIIVSNASPDAKEAKMRALPEWKHLFEEVFPGLRYARVTVDYNEAPAEPAVPVAEPADITVEDETVEVSDTLKVNDTTRVVVPALTEPVQEPAEPVAPVAPVLPTRYPRFAVSTNVVYDLAGIADGFRFTPNFSVELPIGNKWSTFAEYTFPWWLTKANDQAWQILKWDIGARRWLSRHNANDPMDILSGHFLGIDLGAGYYDIEPKHKGWQGEFQTVGLEYGYAWKLGRAWRLDAYVGAGWMGTHYRYYAGDSTDQHLIYQHHGKLTWFGPTKAGISVKYIFNTERRSAR